MIFDCFPFFNELETLEIRLNELYNTVDFFVLAEATKTHSNQRKPLYFADNIERFDKFKDKIVHLIVDDMPNGNDHWERERYQRDKIGHFLKRKAQDNDLIILSDCDEVPKASVVKKITLEHGQLANLDMDCFQYFYNLKGRNSWNMGKACNYSTFKLYNTASDIRNSGAHLDIKKAGWHFGYIGGLERVVKKIQSFAHQEFNSDYFLNSNVIKAYITMGFSIWDRTAQPEIAGDPYWKYVDVNEEFPDYLVQNKDKFQIANVEFSNYDYDAGSLKKMAELLLEVLWLDGEIVEIGDGEGFSTAYLANICDPQKLNIINKNKKLQKNLEALTTENVELCDLNSLQNKKIKFLSLNRITPPSDLLVDGILCGYQANVDREKYPNAQIFGDFWWIDTRSSL
jgi:beta-1,4-mannosyl-glycoprotein beta-1,4-N-acetylglucosaminyltransferase